ncbi:GspH/FimT family pseudopilin [Rheinheimera baltica]|uniref:GspH/FimT family pseudopilin n=1 Tax=Rheinheimera baltica TaxID=67576 RepID=UPI00273DA007|nr:GspH/FimT family pseudopilin [Rheinheimera baltica]MDP5189129.1 GspH/FimT family pseudopilin [Rheinheimera baltica]
MSRFPDLANNSSGFTLVELMVTIAVLSIVMLVAVPSFNSLVQGNKLTGQVNQFVAALNLAKAEAVKRNQTILFCHSVDATSCSAPSASGWQGWVVGVAQARPNSGIVAGSVIASGMLLSDRIVVISGNRINQSDGEVRFLPQGLVRTFGGAPLNSALGACLTISGEVTIRHIGISSGGQVDVTNSTSSTCTLPLEI